MSWDIIMLTIWPSLKSLHLIHNLHSCSHFPEDGIAPTSATRSSEIKEAIVSYIDEKLGTCRRGIVGTSHGECTTEILESILTFMSNGIASDLLDHTSFKTSSLDHESRDDAMEDGSIIEAIFNVFAKIRNSNGSEYIIKFYGDISEWSGEESCFHKWGLIIIEVFFTFFGDLSSARRAFDEADLEKIWFDDIFDGGSFLSYHLSESGESDGSSWEGIPEMGEELAIQRIETIAINSEALEYAFTFLFRLDVFPDGRIVPKDLHIPIRDTRSTTRTFCYSEKRISRHTLESKYVERPTDDLRYLSLFIEVEFEHIAEPVSEWAGEGGKLGRSTDEREAGDIHTDTGRASSWTDHDIDTVVLHRRVEYLFDLRSEPVDLIYKEDLSFSEAREKWDDIGLLLYRWSTRMLDGGSHLMRDDGGYRGFPKSWRSVEEDMFKWSFADLGWSYRNPKMRLHRLLSYILVERAGAEWNLWDNLFVLELGSDGPYDVRLRGLDGHDRHKYMENDLWSKEKIKLKIKSDEYNLEKVKLYFDNASNIIIIHFHNIRWWNTHKPIHTIQIETA